jgi:hypothetical protein
MLPVMPSRFSRKGLFCPGVSMQDLVRGGDFHSCDGQHRYCLSTTSTVKKTRLAGIVGRDDLV